MKDSYIYEAEYISKVNGNHYLNIDLGFQIWKVLAIELFNPPELKHGDRIKIVTFLEKEFTGGRKYPVNYKYKCHVLEKEVDTLNDT